MWKIEVETSFFRVLMILNSKASSSQQNLQMTLKKVWIVSYLVFITDVQMCGSLFVCKYELRNCGRRMIWLLHFHFAFLMTIAIENPLRPIFVIVIVGSNAVETFEPFLQNSESKCSFYINISIWYFMCRYVEYFK